MERSDNDQLCGRSGNDQRPCANGNDDRPARSPVFISLVGFMFLDTRVFGIPVPFHINFEEVNLRFYVKREAADGVRRGVVFIREIVPRFAIAAVASMLYGEPYERWAMSNSRDDEHVRYSWEKVKRSNTISAERDDSLGVPDADSHGQFITSTIGDTRSEAQRAPTNIRSSIRNGNCSPSKNRRSWSISAKLTATNLHF